MARLVRPLSVAATLTLASAVLASCGAGGAVADARHSCVDVKLALGLQQRSQEPGLSATQQSALQAKALSRLLKATPAAAAATSIDGTWNPLMTTINEAERVPLFTIVGSLTRLCRVADSKTPYL
ncbi:MAG: hypothetical protein ACYDB2_11565 [Acidimicrobiales bacterium]